MIAQRTKPSPPTDDKRWKIVDVKMRRAGYAGHALIETLHSVQDTFGYLDEPSMRYVAESLSLPLSKIYGVATFYHHFTLKPKGAHTCVTCSGTACYIKGSAKLADRIYERFGVRPGETTKDMQLSVLEARCVGACSLAPVAVLDGEVLGKLSPDQIIAKLEEVTWT